MTVFVEYIRQLCILFALMNGGDIQPMDGSELVQMAAPEREHERKAAVLYGLPFNYEN